MEFTKRISFDTPPIVLATATGITDSMSLSVYDVTNSGFSVGL